MKRSFLIPLVILAAFAGALLGILFTVRYLNLLDITYTSIDKRQQRQLANYGNDSIRRNSYAPNFEYAARAVVPGVVHISTVYGRGDFSLNPLELYFRPQAHSSGSGVIISDDGFIVTNNHVIEDATGIEVVMNNNQRYYAKLIGHDKYTDLALLKIKANNLPFVPYGNSDTITPGEWVLAIGNPFDLNSTVTAGIVSAKARNIGILRSRNNLEVESFIQTDAAVNPGNSGGALVNLQGELIGINSAIATSTGGYDGYSFAIPVSLVKKVMDDFLEFGQVQRGLLGVQIQDVTAELAEDKELDVVQGVYIDKVYRGSAAEESGITSGDVIIEINDHTVNSGSEMQEWVARNRPGQTVQVMYRRSGENKKVKTVLKNYDGTEEMKKKEVDYYLEGATLEDVPYPVLTKLRIDGGAYLKSVDEGRWKKAGIRDGFIVTYLDKVPVENVDDLNRILELKHGGVLVEGVYHNGQRNAYALMWSR